MFIFFCQVPSRNSRKLQNVSILLCDFVVAAAVEAGGALGDRFSTASCFLDGRPKPAFPGRRR